LHHRLELLANEDSVNESVSAVSDEPEVLSNKAESLIREWQVMRGVNVS
jgi:hypothetical protein